MLDKKKGILVQRVYCPSWHSLREHGHTINDYTEITRDFTLHPGMPDL